MRITIAAIILLFATGCKAASTTTVSEAKTKLVELHTTRTSTKKEENESKAKQRIEKFPSYGICAGSFISREGDILTAQHCVDGATTIDVIYAGNEYRATIKSVSKAHDLAMIHIDAFNTPFFRLATSLEQGQNINVLGSPLGITGSYSRGYVAKLNGDVTYLDCGVLPGNSGGPVFDEDGDMVGVAVAGFIVMAGTTHLNIMQSYESIRGFILYGN